MAGNRAINYKDLRDLYELKGPANACRHLREAIEQRHLRPSDFSIAELFETFVEDGRELRHSYNPNKSGTHLVEAGGAAVSTAKFSNIFGQISYTATLEAFQDEEYVFTKLIPPESTKFNGQKVPGMAKIGDEAEVVDEGQPYPIAGVSEDYIETPATKKRGLEVDVTKEAVFFDNTGLLLTRCADVGHFLGLNREKRAIDCLIDENAGAVSMTAGGHRYHWRGTSYASYQTSTPYDNVTASATLVDWTDLDEAEQTLAGILDPFTGEPISNTPTDMVVTRQNLWTAQRIVNATEITVVTPGYATTGNPTETKARNPVSRVTIHSSQLLAARMVTDTTWYLGTIAKYAKYMENWPITVTQAPAGNSDDFNRDIVQKFKCSERGQYATIEPRVMNESTVA